MLSLDKSVILLYDNFTLNASYVAGYIAFCERIFIYFYTPYFLYI